MIKETIIQTVYQKHAGRVSLANVRSILEVFETVQETNEATPVEVRAGEKVFVKNSYNDTEEEFDTLAQAIDYITETATDYNWDDYHIQEYFSVIVGRKVTVKATQVTTVTLS